NVGTGIAVTSTSTLSGTKAGNYTLTQPTGLTANITAKALTISGAAAQNKPYDANTSATITGTLSGVLNSDDVTLTGTGTFNSANIGTGIAVTSTSTLGGTKAANYTLTQPTGLTANITSETNSDLISLTSSDGVLSPVFDRNTNNYTATVPNSTSFITVTPVKSGLASTITVNGVTVASNNASPNISLNAGSNTITVVVTAQDGITTKTYKIIVTRIASTNADLTNLTTNAGTLSPSFSSSTVNYSSAVPNATSSIILTPTASGPGTTIKVNGITVSSGSASSAIPLTAGSNTITTVVTAQDGVTIKTYTVTITRAPSSNADLSSLVINSATLSPTFSASAANYTSSVPNGTSSVTVTPIISATGSTIKINGNTVASGTASSGIVLTEGVNTITTVVTAPDGTTTKTYTVQITRAGTQPTPITYTTPVVFTKGAAISPLNATLVNQNGPASVPTFSITPALPAGLSLNTTTGAITGTPLVISAATAYTVTATNSFGSTTAIVNITVKDNTPSNLVYSTPNIFTKGQAIAGLTPTLTGSATSYSITPALPSGLNFNTVTGVISGTPFSTSVSTTYTVTASNSGGSTSGSLSIKVITLPDVYKAALTTNLGFIPANNSTTSQITVQLNDTQGEKLNQSGGTITLATTLGTISTVTDNNDGTYLATITSSTIGMGVVSAKLNGVSIPQTVSVNFTGPQGSIVGNGPIIFTDIPTLTFTATAGKAPFTLVVKENNSGVVDTLKNVQSDVPVPVKTITQSTTYKLLSITDADGATRNSNITRDTISIVVVVHPQLVVTLSVDSLKQETDSSFSTQLTMKVKNVGDIDLSSVQVGANLANVFPPPVEYILDSVVVVGSGIQKNTTYDGINNLNLLGRINTSANYQNDYAVTRKSSQRSTNTSLALDGEGGEIAGTSDIAEINSEDKNSTTSSPDNNIIHSAKLFGSNAQLPIGGESEIKLYVHIKPNGYTQPFTMQVDASATANTVNGPVDIASLSNSGDDPASHPDFTGQGDPVPTVISLSPKPSMGIAMSATKLVAIGDGTYNVKLSYKLRNYGNVNLSHISFGQDLKQIFGSLATYKIVEAPVATNNLYPNTFFDGSLDTNVLVNTSQLAYRQESEISFTVNIKPNQLKALYTLQALAMATCDELKKTITDLSTDGLDPDTDGDGVPDESLPTYIAINTIIPTLETGDIAINTGGATRALISQSCMPVTNINIVPTTVNKGGVGGYKYQWQSSKDNFTYTDIPGAIDSVYTTDSILTTTYLRREVTSGNQVKNSNVVLIRINFVTAPVITASGPLVINPNTPLTLSSSVAKTYDWSSGEITKSISVTKPGKYWVSVIYDNGCPAKSDTLSVIPPVPVVKNGIFDSGNPVNPSDISSLATSLASYQIVWYDNNGSNRAITAPAVPVNPDIYTYYVSHLDPVSKLESDKVKIVLTLRPWLKAANATYIIGGINTPANVTNPVLLLPGSTLNYYTSIAGGTKIPVPVIPSAKGTYTYYVSETYNNIESAILAYDITMVNATDISDVQKILSKPAELQADGTMIVRFVIRTTNLRNDQLDSVRIKDDLKQVFPSSVSYQVVQLKASGKLVKNSFYDGKTYSDLLADGSVLSAKQTDSVELILKVSPNGFNGDLYNTAEQTAKSAIGTFKLSSTDPASVTTARAPTKFNIPVVDVIIPTGFSPNNDGVNDTYVIIRPYNTVLSLEIFNRWGATVYKSADYNNDWNGKTGTGLTGKDLPEGTYYYVVNVADKATGSVRRLSGYLTLKR
ncbi:MAG: cytochrome c, 20 heme-binding site, partial [Chitinophagaceae bacterium]|nr:cytochrome c, 20 heme-binding site [Chitinophagaceae bacterium]